MPATVESLATFLGITPSANTDVAAMAQAVAGANSAAVEYCPAETTQRTPAGVAVLTAWEPRIDEGAVIWAARLYGRRGSLGGAVGFQETGVAMLPTMDPDVGPLWRIGRWQRNVVA